MIMINAFEIIQLAIILAVSIGLHEYAHAYTSYRLWDPTPKLQNRLTPNPLRHIDPIWFLMIFLIHFWRGKPVQINPMYYKKPRQWELIVALAGPATNIVLAIVGTIIVLIYSRIYWIEIINSLDAISNLISNWTTINEIFINFRWLFIAINLWLAVFNMIPIPPLDWFRLIKMFRQKAWDFIEKYTLYISIFFLILIIWPGSNIIWWFIWYIVSHIFNFMALIFWQIFY